MAEVVGLVASVVQLAGAGLKLSQTLYQYADGVASADRRIKDIANEVKLTSFVIQELGTIFERDETANLISENAVRTANETIKECFAVFTELELKINKGKPGKMGRLMLPFKDNKIELLRSQIDKLKSTLELLMQVLIHAHQVSSEKYNREAEAKHREEIKQLLENKKQATKKYEESLRNFSISDGSTVVDEGDRSLQDEVDVGSPSNLINAASAIGSTINPDTLATCVDHVRSLLADIETLQLALTKQVDGDDHADHHQKAIGSYFLARSHLDSVLLGNAQAKVTDTSSQPWISKTSTHTSVSATLNETAKDEDVSSSSSNERARIEFEMWRVRERVKERTRNRVSAEVNRGSTPASRHLERVARNQRAKVEHRSGTRGSAHRPPLRAESEDIPLALPPSADYMPSSYREEYAPTLRRTSNRTDPETDGASDGELVTEVSDQIDRPGATHSQLQLNNERSHADDAQHPLLSQARLAKLEARARDERLWQEELRRREGSSAPERVKATNRRDSLRPTQTQLSQPARDRSPSSSLGYLSEEIRNGSCASSRRVQEAKRSPKKDKDKIEHDGPPAVMASCDDSSETNEPNQREKAIAREQMRRRRRNHRERKEREEQEKTRRECKYNLNLQAHRNQELHLSYRIIEEIGLTLPSDIEKLKMPELAEQSSTHAGEPAPTEEIPADPQDSPFYSKDGRVKAAIALLLAKEDQRFSLNTYCTSEIDPPEDDQVNQQMALLLTRGDPTPGPDSNCTFRIDLPEDRDACDFEPSSSKTSMKKKDDKTEQTKPLMSASRRHGSFKTHVRSHSVSSRGSDVDKQLERAKARREETNMEYDRRREQERRKESNTDSTSTRSSGKVPHWQRASSAASRTRKSIDSNEDTPESAGPRGRIGAATRHHERSCSRSRVLVRVRSGVWEFQYKPAEDGSDKQGEGMNCESESNRDEERAGKERIVTAASEGVTALQSGHRELSPSRPRRTRRPRPPRSGYAQIDPRYHSDSSSYVSPSEKIEREQEGDRINQLEEETRRDRVLEGENKGAERERRRGPLYLPQAIPCAVDTSRKGEQRKCHPKLAETFITLAKSSIAVLLMPIPLVKETSHAREQRLLRQRQESSEEYSSPSIQEDTSESEEAEDSWSHIDETEKVGRVDEVDELLKEWTTLLG
ncbi:uncharacterized protein J4E79_006651 [Alternaria viburni]|uniref:uncharacterized protein n=1 Tax=Alternaria viburni TaxID=566460 RepID=UPI0020C21B0E|nr:uncharacterized protein J4E79_006651 [Alternaria viburni]KAI4658891.1 hypothetical protein J4E79_006651 [Alternaria viburni]